MADRSRWPLLSSGFKFLDRWHGHNRVLGLDCFLPECRNVVARRTAPGRQRWYCSEAHRAAASDRRLEVLAAIARAEGVLASSPRNTPGLSRRHVEADLRFLRICLLAYPDLSEVPPAGR